MKTEWSSGDGQKDFLQNNKFRLGLGLVLTVMALTDANYPLRTVWFV
jgi:hypothetical protein